MFCAVVPTRCVLGVLRKSNLIELSLTLPVYTSNDLCELASFGAARFLFCTYANNLNVPAGVNPSIRLA